MDMSTIFPERYRTKKSKNTERYKNDLQNIFISKGGKISEANRCQNNLGLLKMLRVFHPFRDESGTPEHPFHLTH
jgi:hypothetical protein